MVMHSVLVFPHGPCLIAPATSASTHGAKAPAEHAVPGAPSHVPDMHASKLMLTPPQWVALFSCSYSKSGLLGVTLSRRRREKFSSQSDYSKKSNTMQKE